VHVSVRAAALPRAGYASLAGGLADLALRRLEANLTPACEVPRLDGDGASQLPVATDGGARAYRQHLYDRAVSLSALRVSSPPAEDTADASLEAIRLALRAAETIGAPVICLDPGEGAADGTDRLAQRLSAVTEETAGTRVALTVGIPADARALDALVSPSRSAHAPRARRPPDSPTTPCACLPRGSVTSCVARKPMGERRAPTHVPCPRATWITRASRLSWAAPAMPGL
jgi:hypothetical protein